MRLILNFMAIAISFVCELAARVLQILVEMLMGLAIMLLSAVSKSKD